jgi:hypothetical protein
MHTELLNRFIDAYTEILQCMHRIETIFASTIARNPADSVRQGCQDDGAMGDGLIAGDGDRSL